MLRLIALLLFFAFPLDLTFAQQGQRAPINSARFSMSGTHTIVFNAGSWSLASSASVTNPGSSELQSGGFVGSITHKYWLSNRWAIGPSISIFDTGAKTFTSSESEFSRPVLLTTILIGVNYSFILSQDRVNIIFYVSASLGPYMTSTVPEDLQSKSVSVTAFGVRPQAGMHWFLNNWLLFDFSAGYHQVSDFSQPVGKYDNYSGIEFSMGLGLAI